MIKDEEVLKAQTETHSPKETLYLRNLNEKVKSKGTDAAMQI